MMDRRVVGPIRYDDSAPWASAGTRKSSKLRRVGIHPRPRIVADPERRREATELHEELELVQELQPSCRGLRTGVLDDAGVSARRPAACPTT
jgi:hypothetical protein